jgi:predicted deacetylase
MKAWLLPIARALHERRTPLAIFFRDDDGGWADGELTALLDLYETCGAPLDVALIPSAVGNGLTGTLTRRLARGAAIGLHQHGLTHRNHEPGGRPCEFGPSRSASAQHADIAEGRSLLVSRFGPAVDSIFTPPWNRCTPVTASCLVANGIRAISRDRTAGALNCGGLIECPIAVDWFGRQKGVRLSRDAWTARVAAAIAAAAAPLGFMLHHAQMGADDFEALAGLLYLLTDSDRVRLLRMRDAVAGLHTAGCLA